MLWSSRFRDIVCVRQFYFLVPQLRIAISPGVPWPMESVWDGISQRRVLACGKGLIDTQPAQRSRLSFSQLLAGANDPHNRLAGRRDPCTSPSATVVPHPNIGSRFVALGQPFKALIGGELGCQSVPGQASTCTSTLGRHPGPPLCFFCFRVSTTGAGVWLTRESGWDICPTIRVHHCMRDMQVSDS